MACALGHTACRDDRTVLYQRAPKLFAELAVAALKRKCTKNVCFPSSRDPGLRTALSAQTRRKPRSQPVNVPTLSAYATAYGVSLLLARQSPIRTEHGSLELMERSQGRNNE
ncbi:hypothetical protein [Acidiphilium sp.]|uniref:hypothetical protein n=1 Tax=Acidiphilium sp. TaxID=527 RepID=UPI0038D1C65F